jgi:hypothetical protein
MDSLKKLFLRKSSKYQPASTEDYEDKVSPLLQQPGDDVVKENINRNKYQKLTGQDESDDNSNYLLTYFPSRINNKDDMPLSEEQLNDFFKETRALRHEKIASCSEAEHDAIRALKIAIYSSAGYGANDKNNKPNMRSGIESASKELSEYVNDERLSQEMIQKIKNNLSKHIYSHLDLENVSVVVRNKIIQACKIATASIPQIAYSELIFAALSKLDKTFATEVKGIEYDCKSGCFSSEDGLVCHVFTDADELYLSFGGTTSKDNLGLATNGAQWKSNMLSIFNVTSN